METDSVTLTCAVCGQEYVARPEDATRLNYVCDDCVEARGCSGDDYEDDDAQLFADVD